MATRGNSRDVKITLSVDTLGEEGIRALQSNIAALAREGGAAAPAFERLAAEIEQLGAQAASLNEFRDLATDAEALATQQREATAAVAGMRAELETLQQATNEARAAQRAANGDLVQARKDFAEAKAAIQQYSSEYTAAEKRTDAYKEGLRALRDEQTRLNAALIDARETVRQSNGAVNEAVAAEAKLERAYTSKRSALQSLDAALVSSNAEMERAAAAARELGVSIEDIAAEQLRLTSALNQTAADAAELAEAERLLGIEQRAMADLSQRAANALEAEQAALREAEALTLRLAEAAERAAAGQRAFDEAMARNDNIERTTRQVEQLRRETEALENAERRLSAQNAFQQVHDDARRLEEAKDYVKFWTLELEKAEIQEKKTADAAAEAAQRIETAFSTVGVRSLEQINREIAEVRGAMSTLASVATQTGQNFDGAFARGAARIRELEREARELTGTLTLGDKAAKLFSNSLGQIAAGNLIADAIGALVERVKEMGRQFVVAIVQIDQLRRGLNAIYKDAATTASQINFLRQASGEAGVAVGGLSKEFVKFSAAMQSAGVPIGESNALFKELVTASASLGLSAEETAGSLNALGQMASKGTVSMEELRQQLGDRLPGAFGLVANGLGITQAQLVKLVESGNLAARDLFPALTQALRTMRGETDGLVPTWERLKGAMTEAAQASGDAVWTRVLTAGLKGLAIVAAVIGTAFVSLSNAIGLAGTSAAIFFGPGLGSWKDRMALFNEELDKAADRQRSWAEAIGRAIDPTLESANAAQKATEANLQLGQSTQQVLTANQGLERSAQLAAVAVNLAGNSALTASAKYVQFNLAGVELLKQQQQETEALEKSAKATKTRGDSLVDLARLQGQEAITLQASKTASEEYAVAAERVAASKRQELAINEQLVQALVNDQKARGLTNEQIKVQKDELDKKVTASKAEVEQSNEAAAAATREATARRLAVQTYADNSARVDEYRRAIEAASQAVREMEIRHAQGKITDEQLTAARQRLTEAQVLYRDALNDSVGAIQREASAKAANLQLESANYSARAQSASIMAQAARAIGDNATALYYEIEAKKANIEVTRIRYQLMKLEAEAEIKALEIKKLEIPANDALRTQKIQEIEIRIQLQKVKLLEAGAGQEVINALEREVTAMRNNANARGTNTASIDKDTASRYSNAAAIDKQTESLKNQKLTSDGFKTNKDGSAAGTFNNTMPLNAIYELQDKQRAGTLSANDLSLAETAYQQAFDAKRFVDNLGTFASMDAINSASGNLATTKTILDSLRAQQGKTAPGAAQVGGPVGNNGSVGSVPNTSGSKTVNINFNGKSQGAVNVASPADAESLTRILRGLENSAGSAI